MLGRAGPDAEAYLQGQLSQDIAGARRRRDGRLPAARARREALGVAAGDPDRRRRASCSTSTAGSATPWWPGSSRFLLRSKVEIERLPWRCLSLRGAAVDEAAAGLLAVLAERGVLALPFEWNGWSGIDLLGPDDVVLDADRQRRCRRASLACGRDAVEACRIASGIPAMGSELTDKTIAAEAGLVERTVELHQGLLHGPGARGPASTRGVNVAAAARRGGRAEGRTGSASRWPAA